MRTTKFGFGLVAAISLITAPSAAIAQTVIPPGNSAVNQYTQTFPTAGGNTPAQSRGGRSPAKVLGARNAHRLDAKGPQGRAAAALAATAPVTATVAAGKASSYSSAKSGGGVHGQSTHHAGGAGQGSFGGRGDDSEADVPSGSSGLGQVIGQATGSSSSGQMGLLFPLVIVGAILWSIAYLWRQKRRTA